MRLFGFLKWIALAVVVAIAGPIVLKDVDLNDLFGNGPQTSTRPTSSRVPPTKTASTSMPSCTNGRRAPVGGSCVIDGDSGWLKGEQWRMEGIDAPEIGKPECAEEREVGERAKRRLSSLLAGGFTVERGRDDRYGRQLVTFTLADGRNAGDVLMRERLAQKWPNQGNPWCR